MLVCVCVCVVQKFCWPCSLMIKREKCFFFKFFAHFSMELLCVLGSVFLD